MQEGAPFTLLSSKEADYELSLASKWEKQKTEYGWEVLKWTTALGLPHTDEHLASSFDYLKHLWNLFKTLYEEGSFSFEFPEEVRLGGKEYWIFSQWQEVQGAFEGCEVGELSFAEGLCALQQFTRGSFSWYVALIKQESEM